MFHPSIHLEIARQRQQGRVAQAERDRIARAAVAGGKNERDRRLIDPAVREPSPTTTARRPQGANA